MQFGATGDWTFRALLDTGAPVTFFDRGVADALGVRMGQTGAQRARIKILGGEWDVQFEDVDLILGDASWPARPAFVRDPAL